jgi:hypothetical protein
VLPIIELLFDIKLTEDVPGVPALVYFFVFLSKVILAVA